MEPHGASPTRYRDIHARGFEWRARRASGLLDEVDALSAGQGTFAQVRIERLKLRRAVDGLQAIRASLTPEWAGALYPEHLELQLVARELADHIDTLR